MRLRLQKNIEKESEREREEVAYITRLNVPL